MASYATTPDTSVSFSTNSSESTTFSPLNNTVLNKSANRSLSLQNSFNSTSGDAKSKTCPFFLLFFPIFSFQHITFVYLSTICSDFVQENLESHDAMTFKNFYACVYFTISSCILQDKNIAKAP